MNKPSEEPSNSIPNRAAASPIEGPAIPTHLALEDLSSKIPANEPTESVNEDESFRLENLELDETAESETAENEVEILEPQAMARAENEVQIIETQAVVHVEPKKCDKCDFTSNSDEGLSTHINSEHQIEKENHKK